MKLERIGPSELDADLAPGGIVWHIYALPTERLLLRRAVTDAAVANDLLEHDMDQARLELRVDEDCVRLIVYDGDTGSRIGPMR